MKKPSNKPSSSSQEGSQVVNLRGYPLEALNETPAALEARLTKFAGEMVDFEWRYRKSEDALDKVVVSGLDSLKGTSAFKFKRQEDASTLQNVMPLAGAKPKNKT